LTRIKICGITNVEDARAAVDYGAHALGFILVPESPRFIGRSRGGVSAAIQAPPFVARVAVVRTRGDEALLKDDYAFDTYQVYSIPTRDFWPADRKIVLAIRVCDSESFVPVETVMSSKAQPHALLLDTYHKDMLGGSGETFNWDLAVEAKERFGKPIILAGGLTPDNVGDAIAKVRPYAVDVSSGVEAEPGRKDHAKLKAFIRAVREADRILEP
jgi:phosphoribosylanthranilate isomerase